MLDEKMKNKFKKGDKISIKQRFAERAVLIRPFIRKYNQPVLVHSTPSDAIFRKILKEGKLRVPNVKDTAVDKAYLERMFGIYPCIFLSLRFTYSSDYRFKYSFIFDLDYIKKAKYYMTSMSYKYYKTIIQYWDKHNPEYLEKLANKNKTCREVIDKFYNEEYNGKKRVLFDFWKVEKETFELFEKYPKKKEVIKILRDSMNSKFLKYPASLKNAKKEYSGDNTPEIIVKKDINLKKDKLFLGFYIIGKIPEDLKDILKRDYPDKIFYDGKSIGSVGDL